jgi:ribosomal-protein-serine acetyltransferase
MSSRGEGCDVPWLLPGGAVLRLFEETDARELQALIKANRAHLARWLPWAATQTTADTLGYIRATRAQLGANDGFQTAIVREGRIAGVVGFRQVDWAGRCTSLGYWLAADEQGRGTMTAAVQRLTVHAFTIWELTRVEIRVATENRRSRAVPERLGFELEKVVPRAERVGKRQLDRAIYAAMA